MKVLISGASIAGPTLAYWLARHGHRPTVVELAPGIRAGGYPIDVRGPAVLVAERMGVLPRVRDLAVDTAAIDFVRADGSVTASMDMRAIGRAAGLRDLELRRGDLACTLYEAGKDMAEYRFGDSIRAIAQDDTGVDVEFEHAPPERFDIVIGADGQHSQVRSLAFGPEARFARYLGYHVGGAAVDPSHGTADRPVMYNTPGRAAGVYRFGAEAAAIFLFRRAEPISYDHRDIDEHKRIVAAEFAHEDGWVVPRLLAEVLATDDFYFDSLSQIRMPGWSRGRVALAGDAGYGPALLSGSGTTLAMVGAYLLAGELASGDHVGAFARYEAAHRPLVERAQRSAGTGGGFLVPRTPGAIRRRDLLARMARTHLVAARLSRYLPRRRVRLAEYPAVTFTPSA